MSYLLRAMTRIPAGTQTNSKSHTRFPAGAPESIARAAGAYVYDTDGRPWLDCVSGLGSVILGHGDPDVDAAVADQLSHGVAFPLPCELELEVAERICAMIPSAEMVRFAKNGADSCAAAVRIARAETGRERVISLGYHGYPDWTIAHQNPRGVPEYAKWGLCVVPYNDLAKMETALRVDSPACVIMEPVVAQRHEEPNPGYLAGVRELCTKYGALLIFDEVVTFGRMLTGSAQRHYGVVPDLTALGKCLANGHPLNAVVGRADLMKLLEQGVFFSTTHGGEALSLAASNATLQKLVTHDVAETLNARGVWLWTYWDTINVGGLLSGYPSRLSWSWENPTDAKVFGEAMIREGVLAAGYVNLTLAWGEDELKHLTRAWGAGMCAVSDRQAVAA